jgi:hypothetical protein
MCFDHLIDLSLSAPNEINLVSRTVRNNHVPAAAQQSDTQSCRKWNHTVTEF